MVMMSEKEKVFEALSYLEENCQSTIDDGYSKRIKLSKDIGEAKVSIFNFLSPKKCITLN
jgi:hypothetical protein